MKGSPAYYRPEQISPEHAHLGAGQHLAVETMLRTLRSTHRFDPIGVFVPWAKQNGAVNWTTIDRPDHELVVYPIDADTVARVNAASYGSEVPWVAVMTDKPVQALASEQAWDATRYDQFAVEAVYDVNDRRSAPRICFLYWAKLHDDVGGGRDSLDAVAKRLGGRLVFPVQIESNGMRPLPPLPFSLVLDAQFAARNAPVTEMPARVAVATAGLGRYRPFGADTVPVAPVPPAPGTGEFLGVPGWVWLYSAGVGGMLWALTSAMSSRCKQRK